MPGDLFQHVRFKRELIIRAGDSDAMRCDAMRCDEGEGWLHLQRDEMGRTRMKQVQSGGLVPCWLLVARALAQVLHHLVEAETAGLLARWELLERGKEFSEIFLRGHEQEHVLQAPALGVHALVIGGLEGIAAQVEELGAIFDNGLVTFDETGALEPSPRPDPFHRMLLGLADDTPLRLRWISSQHKPFLAWHRQHAFQS
jgi:hypothetical protein